NTINRAFWIVVTKGSKTLACSFSTFYFVILDISAHRHRAFEFFPAATIPNVAPAGIVVRHQNIHAFDLFAFQSLETFRCHAPSNPEVLIRRVDRQMINVSAASIVAAQSRADDCRSTARPSTQSA